mgnify:CR=1 FL=1
MELCFNEMTVMKNGTLPEDIVLCAQAGFSAVELRKGMLLRYLRGGGTLEALRQTLEEQHVRAASLNALESISFQTKAGGRMLRELSDWCFAACRVLGCGCMEVIASFNVPEGISAAAICRETADSLLRLSDAAADYGVRLALEFMAMPGSSVQTFAQCAEILEAVDRANVGMLLDTWHFCAGGSRPEELSALRGDRLFMVHVSASPVHGAARGELLARRGQRPLGGAAAERPGDRLRRPLLRRGHGPERARPAGGGGYPPRGGDDEAAACAGRAVNAQPSARRITGSPVQERIPFFTVTVLRSMRFSYTPSAASTRTSAAFALRENTPTKRLPALPR